MSEGKFLTFPLPLLFPMEDHKRTLERIVYYCVMTVGAQSAAALGEDAVDQIVERKEKAKDFRDCDEHRQIVIGANHLNVNIPCIREALKQAGEATAIVNVAEAQCGRSPLVFIGAVLLWGCKDSDFPTYRDFTVTCAVNSVIGLTRKTPVLIRREMLRARAAGFKTPKAYESFKSPYLESGRYDTPLVDPRYAPRARLTTSELRTALDRLEEARMFVRIAASPRRTYFSQAERATAQKQVAEIVMRQVRSRVGEWRAADKAAMNIAKKIDAV